MVTGTVDVDVQELATFELALTAEWRSVCTGRHNVLLEGSQASTDAVLLLLRPYLLDPVTWKPSGAPFELHTDKPGALILPGVGALGGAEQDHLLEWLDDSHGRTQVVSTTTEPLFSLVARGLFDETLYYRLNVILLHVDEKNLKGSPTES